MTDHFAGDTRSMRERMEAGDLYIADDPELARDSIRALELADRYNRTWAQDRRGQRRFSASCWAVWGRVLKFVRPFMWTTANT
ncbi:maltose acetyltransferase domain-containing protein [Arthrobacter sp. ATA002]|uniref:maltose acetyltransferase domain-containing protein n=1 Tax=Arthrobacter sp. ATA002 TaxID=2991715 RepID=UPI002E32FDEE|nr:maltose acetyltransferase domain-containing protein [Arthrobacter sp. ATA002]